MRRHFLIIGVLVLGLTLLAQEITHKTGVVNIEVPVRVYEGKKFVDNLTIKDFILYEEGKQQKIEAVYLIEKRTLKRKETVEKEDLIKKEEPEERFDPEKQRHFILVFELLTYMPQIKGVIHYFFQNVLLPEDTLQVITPVNSYRLKAESFKIKTKEEMADALLSIIKKDLGIGNSEYRHIMIELKKIVRALGIMLAGDNSDAARAQDEYSSSLYSFLPLDYIHQLISMYESNLAQLERIRGTNEKALIEISTSLKKIEGQKFVFLLYQREYIPQVDHIIMGTHLSGFQDNPDIQMRLVGLQEHSTRATSINVNSVKKAYADASISAQFMFLTKIAERTPFITMQEDSSDMFSAFKTLADATGGTTVSSSSPKFLMEKAVEASENYYLLYYTPKDYKADGKFKKITVKVKGKKYRITHRAGYVAE
jgi:VWFA-related protein